MARSVLIDTAYFVAMLDPRDRKNENALALSRRLAAEGAALVTTDAVLFEFANYFARSPLRSHCIGWIGALRADPGWAVEPIDPALLTNAEARYRQHADKGWSLTDCHSMEVLRARRMTEVATSDAGFRPAGFRILL